LSFSSSSDGSKGGGTSPRIGPPTASTTSTKVGGKRIISGIRPTGFVHLGNYLWRHS
jgi:hypothetical protein